MLITISLLILVYMIMGKDISELLEKVKSVDCKPQLSYTESIGIRREPGELKHLSSRRKRKKHRFPK